MTNYVVDNTHKGNIVFREALEKAMKEKKISCNKLGELMDVDIATIRRWRYMPGTVKISNLRKLFKYGLITMEDLEKVLSED